MQILLSIIAILISFILVIGMHEAGHAVAARLFHIKIKRISLGFGRPLLRWQGKNGVEWILGIWPIGGYVQLLNTRIGQVSSKELPDSFDKQAIWKRIIVLLSGGGANFMVALVALVIFYVIGYQQVQFSISAVAAHSPAAEAGLKSGDRILQLGNMNTLSLRETGMALIAHVGNKTTPITVQDSTGRIRHSTLNLSLSSSLKKEANLLGQIGIQADASNEQTTHIQGVGFFKAVHQALLQMSSTILFLLVVVKQLVTGALPFSILLGPIGIAQDVIASFAQGVATYLFFLANLSLAVGLINLFPIPGLDGALMLYAVVEKVRGRPISVALEILLHRLAVIAFCVLLVQLLLNDARHYLQSP